MTIDLFVAILTMAIELALLAPTQQYAGGAGRPVAAGPFHAETGSMGRAGKRVVADTAAPSPDQARPVVADQPRLVDGPGRVRRDNEQEQELAENDDNERHPQQLERSLRVEPVGGCVAAVGVESLHRCYEKDPAEFSRREFCTRQFG
jgi:hypothetical protein